jgi:hypothetical protein
VRSVRVKVSSYVRLGEPRDYLIVAVIDGFPVAYGSIEGRRWVALGRNAPRLRGLFKSRGGVVVERRYVYEVGE